MVTVVDRDRAVLEARLPRLKLTTETVGTAVQIRTLEPSYHPPYSPYKTLKKQQNLQRCH